MFTLDTNILIYYAGGEEKVISFMDTHKHEVFYLPSIVVVEFLSHPLIDQNTIGAFRYFTYQTTLMNLDMRTAELAAEIRRIHRLKLADAVVTATALVTQSTLVTRNLRDFRKVPGLEIMSI